MSGSGQTPAGLERWQTMSMAELAGEKVMYNEDKIMPNGMNPSEMTGQERLAEVSTLLSLAMMRVWMKRRGRSQSSSHSSCLDERGFSINPSKTTSIRLVSSRNDGSL